MPHTIHLGDWDLAHEWKRNMGRINLGGILLSLPNPAWAGGNLAE